MAFRVRPQEDPLERERREIEARRKRFEERAQRILHSKTRIIGVDTDALSQQIEEKREKERLEAERDLYYDDMNTLYAKEIGRQEAANEARRAAQLHELKFYRKAQEQERRRRSLQDREEGNDLQRVETNFLKFGGEDPNHASRTRQQKVQQQDWLSQQIRELQEREGRDRRETADYDAMQNRIRDIQDHQRRQVEDDRKRALMSTIEFNRQLAVHKRSERAMQRQLEQDMDDQEISNQLNSQFLNEGVHGQGSSMNFKGFTTEQRQRILDEQKAQMDDLMARRNQEAREEWEYAQQQEDIRRAMVLADLQRSAQRSQELRNLADERRRQAHEKTMRYDYLDNVVYTNPVEDGYFKQFGNSCR